LSRWRLAAIDLFKFPDHLPMTLYLCPEEERDRWISGWYLFFDQQKLGLFLLSDFFNVPTKKLFFRRKKIILSMRLGVYN
jgi:uncharacterized protein YhbP (UPF0306 family)